MTDSLHNSDMPDGDEELEQIILTWSSEVTGERRDALAPDALTLVERLRSYTAQKCKEARIKENIVHLEIVRQTFGENEPMTLPFLARIAELNGSGEKG